MPRRSTVLILGLLLLIAGGIYAIREYGRGVADAAALPVAVEVTAAKLLDDFQENEVQATARYVGATDQVVLVSGTIRAMEPMATGTTNVILETGDDLAGVVCEFAEKTVPSHWESGTLVRIKGICTGMLMDVVLVRCVAADSE